MSLEAKIEKLTAAIEKLTANIELALSTPANSAPLAEVAPKYTPAPEALEPEAPAVTPEPRHDDVQSAILAKVRANMDNKTKVKAILTEFKAAKVTDLDLSVLADVMAKVDAL